MPPTAEQIEEIKAHVARLEAENEKLTAEAIKLRHQLREEAPDINAIIVQRDLLAKWHGQDVQRIEVLRKQRNELEAKLAALSELEEEESHE